MLRIGRTSAALFVLATAVGLGSACASRGPDLVARMATAKQTAESFGYTTYGAALLGTVTEGASAKVTLALKEGCYQITVFGGDGLRGIDLAIADPSGKTTPATAVKQDGQASIKQCVTEVGAWSLSVKSTAGAGSFIAQPYVTTTGSGGTKTPGDDGTEPGGIGVVGTGDDDGSESTGSGEPCAGGTDLDPGSSAHGTTKGVGAGGGGGYIHFSCAAADGPAAVYRVHVEGRHRLVADLSAKYDAVLGLFHASSSDGYLCDTTSELECSDDADGMTNKSHVEAIVDTGDYGLVVGSYDGERGEFDIRTRLEDAPSLETFCSAARPITPGKHLSETIGGNGSNFSNSCMYSGAMGGDESLFKLDVKERSRMRASVKANGGSDATIAMRSRCDDVTSEKFCSASWRIDAVSWSGMVDPGSYLLIADTNDPTRTTNLDTWVDLSPERGSGVEGDSCKDAKPLASGSIVADTFAAKDDVVTGCSSKGSDVVYKIDAKNKSRITITGNSSEDEGGHSIALQKNCGETKGEVACIPVSDPKGIDTVVDPGSYYLVVKGRGADNFGRARLNTRIRDLSANVAACKAAPVLVPGKPVTDTTKDQPDKFSSNPSCGGVIATQNSGDKVYQFTIKERSKVNLKLNAGTFYNAIISLRSDCNDPTKPELQCSYYYSKSLDRELDAGTYYVVVDGYGNKSEGQFTLELTIKK